MAQGFKIADAYVEVHLDDSAAKREVSQIPQRIGTDTDRAGTTVGKRMGQSIGDGAASGFQRSGAPKVVSAVEKLSGQIDRAMRAQKSAADAVTLSELRLSEAREKGNVTGSRLLALEQAVNRARTRSADATSARVAAERALGSAMTDAARAAGPNADRAGKDAGDRLAQGMHLAIVRNSPLIAAGVGAALAAGAPAVIAGAGVLFAGIGVVAAAQSEEVQAHWGELWSNIVVGTQDAAASLEPVLSNMADRLGQTFARLQPQLEQAFRAVGPLIDTLSISLGRAAETAMPALVRAVQSAGPVFSGLGHLVEQIGTGLAGFFDAISAHSGAAGKAFAAIGDIVAALLPVLGDLLGQGAELAATILPPLASALGVVASALHAIAPILPTVALGFAAFKIVQTLSGPLSSLSGGLTKFAQNAAFASYQGGAFGKAAGVMSTGASGAASAVSKVGNALPVVGIAVGLIGSAFEMAREQTDAWAQALLDGGNASAQATAQMDELHTAMTTGATGFLASATDVGTWANVMGVGSDAMQDAKDRAKELYDAMSPLQQAQQDVTKTQNDLSRAIEQYGQGSPQAVAAASAYKAAQAEVARQSSITEMAIDGVTEAMVNQANQALAAASSQFAYDSASLQVTQAEQALAEAIGQHGKRSMEAQEATNSLNQALLSQAEAAGRLASDALPATTSELQKNQVAASATLTELYRLRDTMGSEFPTALQQAINGLERSGAATSGFNAQTYTAISTVQNLIAATGLLGAQNPVPTVGLDTAGFDAGSSNTMANVAVLDAQTPTPQLGLFTGIFEAARQTSLSAMGNLAAQRPTPALNLNKAPFDATFYASLGQIADIGGRRPTPTVALNDQASGGLIGIRNLLGSIVSKTVTVTVNQAIHNITAGLVGATGGEIGGLKRRRMSVGGRVIGPGTDTSDDVPFMTGRGLTWLGNREWVIQGAAVRALEAAYGKGAMPTINSGRLPVATSAGSSGSLSKVQGGAVGGNTYVTVNVNGVAFADSINLPDRLVSAIQQGLIKVERRYK